MLAITAQRLITPQESLEAAIVVIEDGRIARFGRREEIEAPPQAEHRDLPEATLVPGFVDLHVHGGAGHDVMEPSAAALDAVSTHLARTGVTSFCPTTVTASADATLRAVEHLGRAIRNPRPGGAQPIGIHLEGPFISAAKCGVHPVAEIQEPSIELLERLWQASGGTIRIVTLAPELPGAVEFTRACVAKNIVVALGHSNAEAAATQACIEAGARHATHTFNAMRALDHREPGILGVVLSDERVNADIIVDGVHVAPGIVKLFFAAKGDERAVLITDAISATGMPEGTYRLGGFEVEVKGDRCLYRGRLAGSVLTMDRAVRQAAAAMGGGRAALERAVRMATRNPARVLHASAGEIAVGGRADLVAVGRTGEVIATWCGGIPPHTA